MLGAISAGLGAIGGALGGGGGQKRITPMDQVPAFAHDLYRQLIMGVGDLNTPEAYGGQWIADQNPWMTQALNGMGGWGKVEKITPSRAWLCSIFKSLTKAGVPKILLALAVINA